MAADVAPGLLRHGQRLPTRWLGFDAAPGSSCARRRDARASGRTRRAARRFPRQRPRPARRSARARDERRASPASAQLHPARSARDVGALRRCDNPRGLVVCNPPYDARLAADPALYRALGNALQDGRAGWRASLLCGERELARATGLRAAKRYQLFNGAIECTLIVGRPGRAAATRSRGRAGSVVGRRADGRQPPAQEPAQAQAAGASSEAIACYRAYDADLPEYAAAIDVYVRRRRRDRGAHLAARAGIRGAGRHPGSRRSADACSELLAAAREVFGVAARTHRAEDARARQGRQQVRERRSSIRAANSSSCAKAMRGCGSTCSTTSIPACSSTTGRCGCASPTKPRTRASSTCSATPARPPCTRLSAARARRRPSTCRRPTCNGARDNLRENGFGGTQAPAGAGRCDGLAAKPTGANTT